MVAVATTAAAMFAVRLSLDPANYFFYAGQDRSSGTYGPWGVALVCVAMVVEVVVFLAAVSRLPVRFGRRAGAWRWAATAGIFYVPLLVALRWFVGSASGMWILLIAYPVAAALLPSAVVTEKVRES